MFAQSPPGIGERDKKYKREEDKEGKQKILNLHCKRNRSHQSQGFDFSKVTKKKNKKQRKKTETREGEKKEERAETEGGQRGNE